MMKIEKKKNWNIGNHHRAKLIDLYEVEKPTYKTHKDSWIKSMPHIYSKYSETEFKKNYDDYIDHLEKFNGCCKKNEEIEIIQTGSPDEVFFSKKWQGKITYHSDLRLTLWKKYEFPFIKNEFFCKMHSFGQIYVPSDDPLAYLEGSGTSISTNWKGTYKVIFDDYEDPRQIEFNLIEGLGASKRAIFKMI
jgi:hypothetical protein